MKKCTLEPEYNTCRYFNYEASECQNKGRCSFQEEVIANNKIRANYVREERWYEKYYRR